jgi:hypothetical protein
MVIEYKHIRFEYGHLGFRSKQTFNEKLMSILNENAADEWELKGCFQEGFLNRHAHLIFGRQKK